jgi:hypothetical protein
MMGCLRRVGCLVVVLVAGAAAWLARDLWWERATGSSPRADIRWSGPLQDSVAMVERITRSRADAWVNLRAADLATLLDQATGDVLREPQVAIEGETVRVRARLVLSEVPTAGALGPLAPFLSGEPRIELAGRPSMASRGTGRLLVTDLRIGGVEVPGPARAALVRRLQRGPASPVDGEIRFSLPPWVGDLRVANGALTVYKDRP